MSAAETSVPDSRTVKVQEAKTRLSELLREVEEGAEITISRGRTPVARLVPVEPPAPETRRRPLGYLRYELPVTFFDKLPPEEMDAWEGEE
ncbi:MULTISPECIES: type II toxin-antitoxin system Phd/YefM family antitoxin [Brachybacterium]|uniref:Antitoxin n=2 Tax=Brachybacterium TaxID=43668 RepID=A0A426SII5_9MICO|nr:MULTISPECIES: type II toxin-antitoxin system prevent-host-death family antitoxin [Brachybacterium]MCT1437135.1 type II toxin-antitoxin system prevent-host-death family antitoxin [Brachybacterium paraconglomeratum]RRR17974.1 type II toxin-antitoxin system prevent-host-death family antitoxin [Brachybacterium paraconglomeratum]GLI29271.1 antitoxin [Brachybacterium conglomeratum]GLK05601.1 antitoxin [Brachybacterium conglomeratum]